MTVGGGALPAVRSLAAATKPGPAERRLLLDSRVVERVENARLALGRVRKEPRNPLFVEDRPWEPRFDNLYANVVRDPEIGGHRCWYSPFIIDEAVTQTPESERARISYAEARRGRRREMGICYADSQDGLEWRKPELGLVEFEGSRRNNIVLRGPHGAGIARDPDDTDPARRYKALFNRISAEGAHGEMAVAFSPDGLRWSEPIACPAMAARGDTHNNFVRDPHSGKYVGITRLWDGRERIVGRSESGDFVAWSPAVEVLRGTPERQTYAMPVFAHAGAWLGLLMVLDTATDTVDCELAWSPDTARWERICPGTPLIPRGAAGAVDAGCIYGAACPVVEPHEIRLYYGGNDALHGHWRRGSFCLARLRPDGFAGMTPIDRSRSAQVVTRPFEWRGGALQISADAAGGSIRASVHEAEGFGLDRCRAVAGEVTDRAVTWAGADLARLRGRTIRLAFELREATLYSFGIGTAIEK